MARIGGSDRIKGQSANGGGFGPMVRVCGCESIKIHGGLPYGWEVILRLCIPVKQQSSSATALPGAGQINFAFQVADLKGGRICLMLWLGY
tara:strand:- start:2335 stop:2607 length:273 start_codon:yes stop_codon:yes gene_type:complete